MVAPSYILAEPTGEREQRSEIAWFRYQGWLTVEAPNSDVFAISPRTALTPHWIFSVRPFEVKVLGGAGPLKRRCRSLKRRFRDRMG